MGFTHAQVCEIETVALPAAQNYLKGLDRTDGVRRYLFKFKHASRLPGRELDSLLAQAGRARAPQELIGALRRIAAASYSADRAAGGAFDPAFAGDDGALRIEALREEPARLIQVVDLALSRTPSARSKSSATGAIRAIFEIVGPMGVRLSSSPKSKFRAIASLCLDALLGAAAPDTERPIRALIRERKREGVEP